MPAKLRDKFTETHSQYYPLVFSAVHTKVDNVDDAHDICQEVFIKVCVIKIKRNNAPCVYTIGMSAHPLTPI